MQGEFDEGVVVGEFDGKSVVYLLSLVTYLI
jgi:hypothetical protein